MNSSLPNYIKTFRRRAFLSQQELAELLGTVSGTTVLRHEADQRVPTLDTALAYAAILQVDPRELFAGRYESQARLVSKRARPLLEKARAQLPTEDVQQKVALLELLVADEEPRVVPCED